ncbi:uncharacterized protein LOC106062887 [Biomphalaria glabrata]|uniref:Uncharacterized protein LOC106062887 n=1 Tax=Biomphalaria glabrata TaxID=6526 RepID=A0A9W2ZFX2_BIOGL|nr:uncharacterized protein LOC106062887 [Biomphalaria glabrata]
MFSILLWTQLVWIVSGTDKILSLYAVRPYSTRLAVTCATGTFNPKDQAAPENITTLALERRLVNQAAFTLLVKFTPDDPVEENRMIKNIPEGRNWEIKFYAFTWDIIFQIVMKDANHTDVGEYRCYFLDKNKSLHYSIIEPLIAIPSQPTINVTKIRVGEPFYVQCDMFRHMATLSLRMVNERSKFGLISLFSYDPITDAHNPQGPNLFTDLRQRDAQVLNVSTESNVSFRVEFKTGRCSDGGLYHCLSGISWGRSRLTVQSLPVTLRNEEPFHQFPLDVYPPEHKGPIFSVQAEGTMVNFTCTAHGTIGLSLQWSWVTYGNGDGNAIEKQIILDAPPNDTFDSNLCKIVLYKSYLSYQAASENSGWTFICSVLDGNANVLSKQEHKVIINDSIGSIPVDKSVIMPMDTLNFECNIYKFNPEDYPEFPYVISLGAERRLLGEDRYNLLARFSPTITEKYRRVSNIPPGRSWNVNFMDPGPTDNQDEFKIVISLNDASHRDAGQYRCNYIDPEYRRYYTEAYTVLPKPARPSINYLGGGQNFIVQCALFNPLAVLALVRKLDGDTDFNEVAKYDPYTDMDNPEGIRTQKSVPPGRDWTIDFIGTNSTSDGNITIRLTVNDGGCADAGEYRCVSGISLDKEREYVNSDAIKIVKKIPIRHDPITSDPPGFQGMFTTEQDLGRMVTLTCTFEGEHNLQPVWSALNLQDLSASFNVTNSQPKQSLDDKNCMKSSYKSQLSYIVAPENDGWTFICSVYNEGNRLLSRALYTVFSIPRETARSTNSAERSKVNRKCFAVTAVLILLFVLLL